MVLKLFASRPLDIRDAEGVVIRHKEHLDWSYLRGFWLLMPQCIERIHPTGSKRGQPDGSHGNAGQDHRDNHENQRIQHFHSE